MNTDHTKVIALSAQQQTAIVDTKNVLASKQDALMQLGQIQAFNFIGKLVTVTELKLLQNIKETHSYKGLTYKNENDQLVTVTTWEECCLHILKTDRRNIDNRLVNLEHFGNDFFESAQNMGLGYRELRKLRQLPQDAQTLIIESEAIDAGDKEAVRELIEDLSTKHAQEKQQLELKASDSKSLANARQSLIETANKNLAEKTEELEKLRESKQHSPTQWLKQVREITLTSTKLMAAACEAAAQLQELNETILIDIDDAKYSEQAIELMASVQLHNVDELFMTANNLSYETRERFSAYIENARPMHTEQEIIAIEQQLLERI